MIQNKTAVNSTKTAAPTVPCRHAANNFSPANNFSHDGAEHLARSTRGCSGPARRADSALQVPRGPMAGLTVDALHPCRAGPGRGGGTRAVAVHRAGESAVLTTVRAQH